MEAALDKLRSGGLLILDNAERYIQNERLGTHTTINNARSGVSNKEWGELILRLTEWRAVLTTNRIWDTRFWVKP